MGKKGKEKKTRKNYTSVVVKGLTCRNHPESKQICQEHERLDARESIHAGIKHLFLLDP